MKLLLLFSKLRHSKRKTRPSAFADEKSRLTEVYFRIERFMEEEAPYLDGSFCLTDMAKRLYINRSLISSAINECTGRNFRAYINSYRVRYASELIRQDPRQKLEQVSSLSGFNTLPTFNAAFRKYMNMTPSQYSNSLTLSPVGYPSSFAEGVR